MDKLYLIKLRLGKTRAIPHALKWGAYATLLALLVLASACPTTLIIFEKNKDPLAQLERAQTF